MASKKQKVPAKQEVKQYIHSNTKRTNNPPSGLAKKEQHAQEHQKYSFDPHLDPHLQWSGKQENTSFEVDTVSIHVHERIDASSILERVKKQNTSTTMTEFFDTDENNPPLHKALEFYKHELGWSNRMIAGDSLLIMNSLLRKEKMESKIQMIYFDPPYGIKYGSNFQPFVNKRNVDGNDKDEDLTIEPQTIKAFRDTWELDIHSYLSYLRDRLLLMRELLNDSGSIFVQISDENVHHVRELMDEIFGSENFINEIIFQKTGGSSSSYLNSINDYIIWYAKDKNKLKRNKLFLPKDSGTTMNFYNQIELPNGTRQPFSHKKTNQKNPEGRIFRTLHMLSQGENKSNQKFEYDGKIFYPPKGKHWKVSVAGLNNLAKKNRIIVKGKTLSFVQYLDEYPVKPLTNLWTDTASGFSTDQIYVVQTNTKVVQRCMLMATEPGDLVLDTTCGSGTTAYVAEKFGRRWITCDTSKIALNLAQRRLMTAGFKYYELTHPKEGVCSGFNYEKVKHVTMGSVANNKPPIIENLYDKPLVDKSKNRISGPFTVEAIPSPVGRSIDVLHKEFESKTTEYNDYTLFQQEWRDEIAKTGIRLRDNKKIKFTDVNTHNITKWLHAQAKTDESEPRLVMISFGPPYSPLSQKQVEFALQEADTLVPKPDIIIFVAMQFDPEALKNIEKTKWDGITILEVNMNTDLLVKDLKKKQSNSESFWQVGQPDTKLVKQKDGKYVVKVNGFDYYDTKAERIVSGDTSKISMWLLDTKYDERNIYPEQMFLTMNITQKENEIEKLAKTLQTEIDYTLIEKYTGFESLPFEAKPNQKIAVKVIDDKGTGMIKILMIEK